MFNKLNNNKIIAGTLSTTIVGAAAITGMISSSSHAETPNVPALNIQQDNSDATSAKKSTATPTKTPEISRDTQRIALDTITNNQKVSEMKVQLSDNIAKAAAEKAAQDAAIAQAKKQAEAKAAKDKADADAKRIADVKAKAEADAKDKREAEAKAKADKEAADKKIADAKAATEKAAADKAAADAIANAKKVAEEKAKVEADAKAKADKEAADAKAKADQQAQEAADKAAAAEEQQLAAKQAQIKAETDANVQQINISADIQKIAANLIAQNQNSQNTTNTTTDTNTATSDTTNNTTNSNDNTNNGITLPSTTNTTSNLTTINNPTSSVNSGISNNGSALNADGSINTTNMSQQETLVRTTIIKLAASQAGTPYVWGGSTPGVALDCSGLTSWVYSKIGIQLPRVADDQSRAVKAVSADQAKPGDLVFLYDSTGNSYHTGILLDPVAKTYWEAPHPGDVVKIGSFAYTNNVKFGTLF